MRKNFKAQFPLESIDRWIYERAIIDKGALAEITASIHRSGVVTPLIVRQLKDKTMVGLGGFLRSRACESLGISTVPAMIYGGLDDLTAMDICLIDNIQHAEMSDWDIASCLNVYREEGLKLEDIATRIQKSTSYISQKLAVLTDSLAIQEAVEEGALTEAKARLVRRLPEELHEQLIEDVAEKTVAETRQAVKEAQKDNRSIIILSEIKEVEIQLEELDKREKEREKLRSEVSSIEGKRKALTVDNKDMKSILKAVETLEDDYFPTVQELETYTSEMVELKKLLPDYDVDELVKDRKTLDTQIGKLDVKITKVNKELKELKKEKKDHDADRKRVQSKISEFNERQRKVTTLKTVTTKLQKKKAKLEEKVGDHVSRYDELKATLADYEKGILTERQEHARNIATLKTQIGKLNGKIGQRSRLEKDLKGLNEELEQVEGKVETSGDQPEPETVEAEE